MPLSPASSERIDEIIRSRQASGRVPRIVAGVVLDGHLVHVTAAGESAPGRPGADRDTVDELATAANVQSRIGSLSKTFTAALVLALRDEGRLDLDEPIGAHLPGLVDRPAIGAITPRRLLAHVSGLRREPAGPWWERNAGVDIPALVAGIDADALVHQPGRTYHYSNLGFGLLGAVVSAVSGMSWEQALQRRILGPLGLGRTTYEPVEPYLRGYVVHPYSDLIRAEPREDSGAMAPAGQIWSTVRDIGTWAAFIADPTGAGAAGPDRPLAPATVDEMCTPVAMSDLASWTAGQGLGIEMWRVGERVYVGHTGSMPGYVAVMAVHRPTKTAVVVLANAYSTGSVSIGDLGRQLLTLVLDAQPARPALWTTAEPPADVTPLLGTWWWMGETYVAVWDGELVIHQGGRQSRSAWRFTRSGVDVWRCRSGMNNGETMYVRRDPSGTPVELDIATFIFSRDPWPDVVR